MSSLIFGISSSLRCIGALTCRTIYNSSVPLVTRVCGSRFTSVSLVNHRAIHYPSSSPKEEKKRTEFPVRTWLNDNSSMKTPIIGKSSSDQIGDFIPGMD